MSIPNPQSENTEGSRITAKNAGALGVATIILGNVATLIGSIQQVNVQIQKVQEQLHLGSTPYLLYAVLGIVFVGYLLASTSLYTHVRDRYTNGAPTQKLVIPGVILLVLALYVLNVWAVAPSVTKTLLKSREAIWVNKIRESRQSDGGLSFMLVAGPGNIEQPWVTAQGLAAIIPALNWENTSDDDPQMVRSAFDYIDSQRASDGGWPYFGKDAPSITEIAGWVTLARILALEHGDEIWPSTSDREKQITRVQEDIDKQIMSRYMPEENGWSPINPKIGGTATVGGCSIPALNELKNVQSKSRTYSTIMALWTLIEAHRVQVVRSKIGHEYDDRVRSGIGWLLSKYQSNSERSIMTWVPNPYRANQRDNYLGLTAQALFVLYRAAQDTHFRGAVDQPQWFDARQDFLKEDIKNHLLGDNSHLSDMDAYVFPYPQPLEPMTFLWAPWSMVAYRYVSDDSTLNESQRKLARTNLNIIVENYQDAVLRRIESGGTYELAESLFCAREAFR